MAEEWTDLPGIESLGTDQRSTARKTGRDKRRERLERKRKAAYERLARVTGAADLSELFSAQPTPVLCVVNVGYGGVTGATTEQIEALVAPCPGFARVIMVHGKPYTFILFANATAAALAHTTLHDRPCPVLADKSLFLEFVRLDPSSFTRPFQSHLAGLMNPSPDQPAPQESSAAYPLYVDFPVTVNPDSLLKSLETKGLYLVRGFVTEAEEKHILELAAEQTDDAWIAVNDRLVQHYGHTFDYQRKRVGDQQAAKSREFPAVVHAILNRVRTLPIFDCDEQSPENAAGSPAESTEPSLVAENRGGAATTLVEEVDSDQSRYVGARRSLPFPRFDQLTIAKYPVGSGISFHSDSHLSFTDTLLIISLANPITMEFRSPFYPEADQLHFRDHLESRSSPATGPERGDDVRQGPKGIAIPNPVAVDLPPRSLLIISGEARYGWEHAIRPRKSDLLYESGAIRPRQFRVSLTLREVDQAYRCGCQWKELCDRFKVR
ncbi:hypothetical protein IWQ60_000088 [Tieghemiomyces parasiticus]|uniref:Fe2OG dioxygenase domain-containing protein n=1 Tax=Tieghemiomyces parasiticus TaxID=78921 RepID=A0A9W8AFH4_9FUNG|nr:hypothetical protein IWQ60_000088 [Tieghemiomyces parasiticus]